MQLKTRQFIIGESKKSLKVNLNFNKTEAFATPRRLGAKINEWTALHHKALN